MELSTRKRSPTELTVISTGTDLYCCRSPVAAINYQATHADLCLYRVRTRADNQHRLDARYFSIVGSRYLQVSLHTKRSTARSGTPSFTVAAIKQFHSDDSAVDLQRFESTHRTRFGTNPGDR